MRLQLQQTPPKGSSKLSKEFSSRVSLLLKSNTGKDYLKILFQYLEAETILFSCLALISCLPLDQSKKQYIKKAGPLALTDLAELNLIMLLSLFLLTGQCLVAILQVAAMFDT